MRYFLSLISLVLIGTLGFQLATVSAVATTSAISGEAKITVIKKQPTLSPKVQLLKLKRTLAEIKKKITLLKSQIAVLKKQIELKVKRGLITTALEKRLKSLMDAQAQAEQTASDIQKKIEATASGVVQKI